MLRTSLPLCLVISSQINEQGTEKETLYPTNISVEIGHHEPGIIRKVSTYNYRTYLVTFLYSTDSVNILDYST